MAKLNKFPEAASDVAPENGSLEDPVELATLSASEKGEDAAVSSDSPDPSVEIFVFSLINVNLVVAPVMVASTIPL